VIGPMQHPNNRACHEPREVHRHSEASAGRPFAWVSLMVIVMLVAEVFAAGASGAFGSTSAPGECVAPPLSGSASQQHASALNRICWPIEAGVDAQCTDRP
jgi:hypothetical protein